jgi:hypothetical protein
MYLMPDYWLEVSLHPEGPATGQLSQVFQWITSVLQQILSCYPNSMRHCIFHIKISPLCCPSTLNTKIPIIYSKAHF